MKYRIGRLELLNGNAGNFTTAAKFKCVLVLQGSTYLLEHPATVGGFGTLNAATASADKTIASVTLTTDTARDKIFVDAADPAWTGLTPGQVIVGLVIYRFVTNTASSIPYYGIPLGQPYVVPSDGTFTFPFDDDGIIEI